MTTPGVSHPSPTTEEDVRRVLDARAWSPTTSATRGPTTSVATTCWSPHDRELVIRAAEPLLRRLVPEH